MIENKTPSHIETPPEQAAITAATVPTSQPESVSSSSMVRLLARWRETLAWQREMEVLRRSEDNHTGSMLWQTQAEERARCIHELEREIGAGKEPNDKLTDAPR